MKRINWMLHRAEKVLLQERYPIKEIWGSMEGYTYHFNLSLKRTKAKIDDL